MSNNWIRATSAALAVAAFGGAFAYLNVANGSYPAAAASDANVQVAAITTTGAVSSAPVAPSAAATTSIAATPAATTTSAASATSSTKSTTSTARTSRGS
ncbi:MAG: hypothetical protein HYX53_01600 [Chloroflexi bacterium]|nr:hypothetical protein [Chloroflexota bacterium]